MKSSEVLTLLCAVVLAAAPSFAAELKVGGGGASIASIFKQIKAPFEKSTGNLLFNLQSTPKNGLVDLMKGKLDAAVAAVPLESMIAGAEKDGVKVSKDELTTIEVGTNKTVVFINKDNKIAALSKQQMKDVFTGKITNWKDVGGADSDILVVWGKNSPGQNALFTKVILDGVPVTKDNLETTDYAGILDAVKNNPGAIGIDPLGMADASVKVIRTEPAVTSPVILVTKGKPSAGIQTMVDFIKSDGKKYITD